MSKESIIWMTAIAVGGVWMYATHRWQQIQERRLETLTRIREQCQQEMLWFRVAVARNPALAEFCTECYHAAVEERLERYEDVSWPRMVFTFWRPVDSYFPEVQ